MIALIGNFDVMELLLIGSVALLVFGKRLPEVAVRGAAQLVRLRRSVTRMWREAGLEEELRRVRREIDRETSTLPSAGDLARESDWRPEVQSDIDSLDLPPSSEVGEGVGDEVPREDHPEDHDEREGAVEEGEAGGDFHSDPDPEPTFPDDAAAPPSPGSKEAN